MWHETFTDKLAIVHATRAATDITFNDVDEIYHDQSFEYAGASVTADKKTMVLCVSTGGSDDDSRRIFVATRSAADATWGTPTVIPELNGTHTDFAPTISADGKTLLWSRDPFGEDIYIATLNGSGLWANAMVFDSIDTSLRNAYPFISQDGRTLVYSERDDSATTGWDLFMVERDCL